MPWFRSRQKSNGVQRIVTGKKGVATVTFDLRGHGVSGGLLDGNCYEDIIDALAVLSSLPEVDNSRIALIGHSLGAFSSILASSKIKKPRAIIALSCPSDLCGCIFKDTSHKLFIIARSIMAFIGKCTLLFNRTKVRVDWKKFLDSWIKVKLSPILAELDGCFKLFVFSTNDLITPYDRFAAVYEQAPSPKQKMLTCGSHATPIEAEILRFEWIGWTVSVLHS